MMNIERRRAQKTYLVEQDFFSESRTRELDWIAPLLPLLEGNTDRSGAGDAHSQVPLCAIRETLLSLCDKL